MTHTRNAYSDWSTVEIQKIGRITISHNGELSTEICLPVFFTIHLKYLDCHQFARRKMNNLLHIAANTFSNHSTYTKILLLQNRDGWYTFMDFYGRINLKSCILIKKGTTLLRTGRTLLRIKGRKNDNHSANILLVFHFNHLVPS